MIAFDISFPKASYHSTMPLASKIPAVYSGWVNECARARVCVEIIQLCDYSPIKVVIKDLEKKFVKM